MADSSSNWAVCGKSSGMVSMPVAANATHRAHIEVMPLFAGHLPFPKIKVFKYLPHTATQAIQPDPGELAWTMALDNVVYCTGVGRSSLFSSSGAGISSKL